MNNDLAPWRARWIKKLINPVYMGALLISNMMFSVFLVVADQSIYWKVDNFWGIMVTAMIINLVFLVDLIANFIVLGPKNVWKEKGFMYIEVILQIAQVVEIILVCNDGFANYSPYGMFSNQSLIMVTRNVRVFNFVKEAQSIKLIAATTRHITKPILGKFLFIYLVFYFYAQLGSLFFGGKLTTKAYEANSSLPAFWYLLNFNDYGASLITLFHQMVVNNWFITVNMFAEIEGHGSVWWVRCFFVSFWIVIVLI